MSVDSADAPPPPPPPPPPPDYSDADQPVTDEGKAPPEGAPYSDADTTARNESGNLALADQPVTDDGQAAPDLTGDDALGAVPDSAGSWDDDGGTDWPGVTEADLEPDRLIDDAVTARRADEELAQQSTASDQATEADVAEQTDQPDEVVADAKAIELNTDAGSAYYGPDDTKMREAAEELKPEQGIYTVDMHGMQGDPDHVYFENQNGTPESLSADQLASVIKDNDNWDGEPVRLFACYAGQDPVEGGDSFGQQLANSLGVEVRAPTTEVSQDNNGNPEVYDGGEWRIFQPRN